MRSILYYTFSLKEISQAFIVLHLFSRFSEGRVYPLKYVYLFFYGWKGLELSFCQGAFLIGSLLGKNLRG